MDALHTPEAPGANHILLLLSGQLHKLVVTKGEGDSRAGGSRIASDSLEMDGFGKGGPDLVVAPNVTALHL